MAAVLVCGAAPQPARANPICSVAGLINGVAGKICTAAGKGKTILAAGKKLLGGHLGGALKTLTGSTAGKAVTVTAALAGVVAWVYAGARFALRETASVISTTTKPHLGSTWFSSFYWRMAGVSALLTLPFLFAAAIQALVRSDLAMLMRSVFGYLPLGMIGVGIAAPLTTLLLAGSDELSHIVSGAAGNADGEFLTKVSVGAGALSLVTHSPFIAFFVGMLAAAATILLWCELLIRSAAVYVIVLMLPLFFAALVWPARRVWAIRAIELLVALILSKFAIVAVLALGGAAIGHDANSITEMLAGATLVLLAAFSPWALLRLLPLHELAAGAAGGLRGQTQGALPWPATEVGREPSRRLLTQPESGSVPAESVARATVERLDGPQDRDHDRGATEAEVGSEATVGAGDGSASGQASSEDVAPKADSAASAASDPGENGSSPSAAAATASQTAGSPEAPSAKEQLISYLPDELTLAPGAEWQHRDGPFGSGAPCDDASGNPPPAPPADEPPQDDAPLPPAQEPDGLTAAQEPAQDTEPLPPAQEPDDGGL
ncbi:MAG TPA: hypothetical protein VGH45_07040 [Solirubrobacteraceae bacterium]